MKSVQNYILMRLMNLLIVHFSFQFLVLMLLTDLLVIGFSYFSVPIFVNTLLLFRIFRSLLVSSRHICGLNHHIDQWLIYLIQTLLYTFQVHFLPRQAFLPYSLRIISVLSLLEVLFHVVYPSHKSYL